MIRSLGRPLRIVVTAALIIAAAPVSLVAGGSVALAWRAGWPPGRLYRAALYCLPMLAAWLAATAAATRSAAQVAAAPYLAWLAMWHRGAAGSYAAAAAVIAPAAIPAGLAAGALAWSYRIRSMQTGSGGLSPDAAVSFDLRQWRHQARSARARITAPGAVPLTTRRGDLVTGAVIRAVGHPARPIASHPLHPDALTSGSDRHHRHRQDHAAVTVVGRVHGHRRCGGTRPGRAAPRCSWSWTARAGPTRGGSPTGPGGCCGWRGPGPPPSGRTRPACPCGRCRPRSSPPRWSTWSSTGPVPPPITPT